MTVKQFAYLAAGTVIAWFFFFILPIPLLIKLPLSIVFLSLGIGFAFIPVDGRPMDTMLVNLFKAMLSPTQYVYKKTGGDLSQQMSNPQPQTQIQSAPIVQTTLPQAQPQTNPIAQISTPPAPTVQLTPEPTINSPITQPAPASTTPQPQAPIVQIPIEEKIEEAEKQLETQTVSLEQEIKEVKAEENTQNNPALVNEAHQKALELERMLTETTRQKDALEKELIALKAKLEAQSQQPNTPVAPAPAQAQKIAKPPAPAIPTAPQDPNLITGIIKDPRGNPLANILVEVKDTDDNPVRAFKTSAMGKFAAATSLSNGKYIVAFEDPKAQNKFDPVEIEATGAPIPPLEIVSVDPREELRRELFN
jgi:hypothetical protein